MRRVFLLVAVMVLSLLGSKPASAQFFGGGQDVNAEIDKARSQAKAQSKRYARPTTPGSRAYGGAQADRFGRLDMAGHPVAGYPAIRGGVGTPGSGYISRGGANGVSRRRGSRR